MRSLTIITVLPARYASLPLFRIANLVSAIEFLIIGPMGPLNLAVGLMMGGAVELMPDSKP